jgi:hypothetical protein
MATMEVPDAERAGMDLLTLEDAASFLGPSFSVRWLRRRSTATSTCSPGHDDAVMDGLDAAFNAAPERDNVLSLG